MYIYRYMYTIWPKTGPFRDVLWIIRFSTFCIYVYIYTYIYICIYIYIYIYDKYILYPGARFWPLLVRQMCVYFYVRGKIGASAYACDLQRGLLTPAPNTRNYCE